MAGRAGRKLQQQQLQQQQLNENDEDGDSQEDESVMSNSNNNRKKISMAAMSSLFGGDSDDSDDDDNHSDNADKDDVPAKPKVEEQTAASKKKKKNKKKKKKKNNTTSTTEDGTTPGTHTTEDGSNTNQTVTANAKDDDDVDAAIAEVQKQFGELNNDPDLLKDQSDEGTSNKNTKHILAVDRRNLNADAELKRYFGSGFQSNQATGNDFNSRNHKRIGVVSRKGAIFAVKPTWPPVGGRSGLQMEIKERHDDGTNTYKIVHSKDYQAVQMKFFSAVESLDPQQISQVLRLAPYHVDGLLQLSEIIRMQEDLQTAGDMVERALYVFERSFHSTFNVATTTCKLDYSDYESRAFFLALFKHTLFVGNRGCWTTALEFSKLLLSLSPADDPLGAALMIDYYALRATEFAWLVRMSDEWEATHHLSWIPSMAFSTAYAHHQLHLTQGSSTDEKACELLTQAIVRFPAMVMQLVNKCGATMPPDVSSAPFLDVRPVEPGTSEGAVRLLELLYVERAHTLWKAPASLDWMRKCALRAIALSNANHDSVANAATRRKVNYKGIPRNILRHVYLSGIDSLMGLLPPSVGLDQARAYDPFPPEGQPSTYDKLREERRTHQTHDIGALEMFLRSIVPGYEQAVANVAARQARRGNPNDNNNNNNNNDNGIRGRLEELVQNFGVEGLVEMLVGEDDGGPARNVPDDFNID